MEDRRFAAIGGLLLIPAAVLVLTLTGYFLAIPYFLYLIFALQDAPIRLWLAIMTAVSFALGLLHVHVVREFFRKKQTVPGLIQGLYLLNALITIAAVASAEAYLRIDGAWWSIIISIVIMAVFIAYFQYSTRVKATFTEA